MAKVINPALPDVAGTTGLWWFAQDLQNLATPVTGDASLSGSALAGGVLVHDATTDVTTLASDSNLLLGTTAQTIMFGLRKRDTTHRASAAFAVDTSGSGGWCHGLVPFSDSVVYWDYGGADPFWRLSKSGLAFDTATHVWAFNIGSRGREIWLDGSLVASNAALTAGRSGSTSAFKLGNAPNIAAGDLVDYPWVWIHNTQVASSLITAISADPEGQLTSGSLDVASGGAVYTWRANTLIGGGIIG